MQHGGSFYGGTTGPAPAQATWESRGGNSYSFSQYYPYDLELSASFVAAAVEHDDVEEPMSDKQRAALLRMGASEHQIAQLKGKRHASYMIEDMSAAVKARRMQRAMAAQRMA